MTRRRLTLPTTLLQRLLSTTVHHTNWSSPLLQGIPGATNLLFQDNNHEEADTRLIYQAVLASQLNPPDAQMVFFSPDTDVLVLVIANYDLMLQNTSISMASGVLQIQPIWTAIGAERAKAHSMRSLVLITREGSLVYAKQLGCNCT